VTSPLAITASALLTPLDAPADVSTWDAIAAGHSVTTQTAVADPLLDPDVSLDRSLRLALAVGRRALAGRSPAPTGLFCGTSKGPIGTFLAAAELARRNEPLPPAIARQVALGVGAMGAVCADRLRDALQPTQVHTSVAACSSGLHALHRAAAAVRRGECPRALVLAADASLHPLFQASFHRLGVLAPADAQGVRRCDPFGPRGEGFFLVEAAAALLLERTPSSPPLAWLEDSAVAADATGLIAIDPAADTLRHTLAAVSPPASPVAFVHAHATGTAHDAYELSAIRAAVGPDVPVFSHKQFLGHSLGAAGLVSAALSVACHRHRRTLTGHPLPADACSLTIAQGFGGHIALLRLRSA
jgi:3-oxoacyl-(acyl-carrier-protein) synthase